MRSLSYLEYDEHQYFDEALSELTEGIKLFEKMEAENRLEEVNFYPIALNKRADLLIEKQLVMEAMQDFSHSMYVQKKFAINGEIKNKLCYFSALDGYFEILSQIENYEHVLLDICNELIYIVDQLIEDGEFSIEDGIIDKMYIRRYIINRDVGDFERALIDISAAINIQKLRLDKGVLSVKSSLAELFRYRGKLLHIEFRDLEHAINDFTENIYLERTLDEPNLSELCYDYRIRANLYWELEQYENAIQDYTEIITICLDYYQKEKEFNSIFLTESLNRRANYYKSQGRIKEAINDYSLLINIIRKNIENNDFTDLNLLLKSLLNRGNSFMDLERYQDAFGDYSELLELVSDNLYEENEAIDDIFDVTIRALLAQSHVLEKMQRLPEAVKVLDELIELVLDINEKDRLKELFIPSFKKAAILEELGEYAEALATYNNFIEAVIDQVTEDLDCLKDISYIIHYRSALLYHIDDFENALKGALRADKYFHYLLENDIHIDMEMIEANQEIIDNIKDLSKKTKKKKFLFW
ncbi:tetratricopeptide repeat protein [Ureibacillus xyleni]|uniref:Tetratricopeptide repeat protein n=1 Tax=Ureibacillus xyleni TaxID=614648 RepID=A0A285TNZ6_9BACL|nr:hypothetical protein [Ureibacillus xyleni]SOC22337.1 tetratricopeptide repeat protein [Ureibacillus xyleni]